MADLSDLDKRLDRIEKDIQDMKDILSQAKGATRVLWAVGALTVATLAFFGGKIELFVKWFSAATEGRTP